MTKEIAFYLADQNPHRDRSLGISNLTKTLLGVLSDSPDYKILSICSKSSLKFPHDRVKEVVLPWATDSSKVKRIFTDNLHPAFLRHLKPDIWYYPKGYISYVARPKGKVVTTVHDTLIQHFADKYPHRRSKWDTNYWIGLLISTLKMSDLVLTVTENSKQQILDFCERHKVPVPRLYVTYEGTDFEDEVPGDFKDKGNYVVHLASGQLYKRTPHLLKWWKELADSGYKLPELRLIGKSTDEANQIAESSEGIVQLPRLNHEEFVKQIQNSRALLFPSEFEGFGLPAIEAYFLGTPVCYVKDTSVSEVVNHSTTLGGFTLDSRESFVHALEEVLGMTESEILNIGNDLREKFSKKRYLENVQAALRTL